MNRRQVLIGGLIALSGFNNPITNALGDLIRKAIRSPNYVPGVSGWSINRDGSAEFNNGVFRGTITNAGMFVYSGAPGFGNPPVFAAVIPGTTTDPYGNNLPLVGGSNPVVEIGNLTAGHVGFDAFGDQVLHATSGAEMWLIPSNPSLELYDAVANLIDSISVTAHGSVQKGVTAYLTGDTTTYAQLLEAALVLHQTTEFAGGNISETQPGVMLLVPGKKTSLDVTTNIAILSKLAAGNPATGMMVVGGGSNLTSAQLEVQGSQDITGLIKAIVGGAEETAQSFTFANGWAAGARSTPQFFKLPVPAVGNAGSVYIGGSFVVPGGGYVAGQNMITAIAAGYRPANPFRILGWDTTNSILVAFNLGNGGILTSGNPLGGIPSAGDNIDMIPTIYAINN